MLVQYLILDKPKTEVKPPAPVLHIVHKGGRKTAQELYDEALEDAQSKGFAPGCFIIGNKWRDLAKQGVPTDIRRVEAFYDIDHAINRAYPSTMSDVLLLQCNSTYEERTMNAFSHVNYEVIEGDLVKFMTEEIPIRVFQSQIAREIDSFFRKKHVSTNMTVTDKNGDKIQILAANRAIYHLFQGAEQFEFIPKCIQAKHLKTDKVTGEVIESEENWTLFEFMDLMDWKLNPYTMFFNNFLKEYCDFKKEKDNGNQASN